MMSHPIEMTVQSTPLCHVFEDAATLSPDEAAKFRGPISVVSGDEKLILKVVTNPRLRKGRICLNSEQKKFLEVNVGDRVMVAEEEDMQHLQSLEKVHLVVHSKFFDPSVPVPEKHLEEVLGKFREHFRGHVMNRGHSIPLKLKKGVIDIEFRDLFTASGTSLSSGIFRESTKIIATINSSRGVK